MKDKVLERFGRAVKDARIDAGLNQTEFAGKLEKELGKPVNAPTIVRIEKGTRPTSISEVYAIARVLGVSIERLIYFESKPADELTESVNYIVSEMRFGRDRALESYKTAERELRDAIEAKEGLKSLIDLSHGVSGPFEDVVANSIRAVAKATWGYRGAEAVYDLEQIAEMFDVDFSEVSEAFWSSESEELEIKREGGLQKKTWTALKPTEKLFNSTVDKLIKAVNGKLNFGGDV